MDDDLKRRLVKEAAPLGYLFKGLKNFSKTNTSKFFGRATKSYKKGGVKGLLDHVSKYKDPSKSVNFGKNIPDRIPTVDMQKGEGTIPRGLRTSLGNTADFLRQVGEGTKGKGVIGGAAQAVKNTGKALGRQTKGTLYKEVDNPVIYPKGDKKFVKSKVPWLKDREVVSQTGRNSAIIRKRKALTPLSVVGSDSGVGVGVGTYALSDKDKSQSKRLSEAATDAGLFAVSPAVGMTSFLMRSPGKQGKKKINKKVKNNKLGDK